MNQDKVYLEPAQAIPFLGHILDTSGPVVRLFIPDAKVAKITAEIEDILAQVERGQHEVRGLRLASLLGKLIAVKLAYAPVRPMTRELLASLRELPYREMQGTDGRWTQVRDYSATVRLSLDAINELRFHAKYLTLMNGCPFCELSPTHIMYTDGSGSGRGALLRRVSEEEEQEILAWTQGEQELGTEQRHSTQTELEALLLGLVNFEGDLAGATILHRTDNVALFYALANGGYAVGANSELNLLLKKVWFACLLLGARLQTEFVGSERIIRSGADLLSRESFDDRSRLLPEAFRSTCEHFQFEPKIDLFAEPGASQAGLPFFTRHPGDAGATGCIGVDALTQIWTGDVFAYPPLPLVDIVIHKALKEVERRRCRVLLIVPHWPQRPWSALLAPFESVNLGRLESITSLPPGAPRPIESQATWINTTMQAVLLDYRGP